MRKSYLLFILCTLAFFLVGLAHASFSDGWPVPPKPLAHHPKIETALLALTSDPSYVGAKHASPLLIEKRDGAAGVSDVTVIIEGERPLSEALLQSLGAQIKARAGNLYRVRVPAENLRALAEGVPGISFIRRPRSLVALGPRTTEGILPTGALLLQGSGWRGQGVKIAVIDLGFAQLSRAKKSKVINPDVIVDEHDYTGEGLEVGTSHGTGVAEIVHAMAPKAWLYLKKVADEVDLSNAVDDAIAQGVQIINYSVGVANANFNDGTGIVAEIADRARAHGVLWVNAAGNHAQSHWMGTFSDRNYNRWLEFAPGREELLIRADFPGSIELYLTWDDWPRTREDFDLFLYDAQGRLVASSQNYQTGFEEPTEQIEYVAWAPGTYRARVLARRVQRTDIRLKIFNLSQQAIDPNIPEGSILTPADARGALAVGAISVRNWNNGPQEPFSSQGPTSDGRIKPDIAGPDGVSNFTLTYFSGTSAAAPHVSGAAALLLSQHPDWTASQIEDALETLAIDLGAPGKDTIYGAGKLDLSLGTIQARRTISPTRAKPGDLITVAIEATMPQGLFGGLELREELPWGFPPISFTWPIVHPGETASFTYELRVPDTAPPGVYRWSGTVNEISIEGDEAIIVESFTETVTVSVSRGRVYFCLCNRPSPPAQDLSPGPSPKGGGEYTPFRFREGGRGVRSEVRARVRVYDLRGTKLFEDSVSAGETLEWHPQRRANGVYLYVIEIIHDGHITQRQLGKIVLLK